MIALKRILVATDFSEPSAVALMYGRELARQFDADLHVLHVADDLGSRIAGLPAGYAGDLGRLQSDLEEAAREQINGLVTDDDRRRLCAKAVVRTSLAPAETILEYARDAKIDCIVLGTHGRTGLKHVVMGSVAERVVRAAPCPVLTVRHREHDFVVPDVATGRA